jgi:hypothetical protein
MRYRCTNQLGDLYDNDLMSLPVRQNILATLGPVHSSTYATGYLYRGGKGSEGWEAFHISSHSWSCELPLVRLLALSMSVCHTEKLQAHAYGFGSGSLTVSSSYSKGPGFAIRQDIPFSSSSRPALAPTQPPIYWVPGAKRPGSEADHSPPTSAEVKNTWIYTSTPPYAFMA